MPAHDKFHAVVKQALVADGWTVTDDPLRLKYGGIDFVIDLGAEKLIAAERAGEKIAVEIKSFVGDSTTYEFHQAVGQFVDYQIMLSQVQPDRLLFLAVPSDIYHSFFQIPFVLLVQQRIQLKLLVYDPQQEVIETWIK